MDASQWAAAPHLPKRHQLYRQHVRPKIDETYSQYMKSHVDQYILPFYNNHLAPFLERVGSFEHSLERDEGIGEAGSQSTVGKLQVVSQND